MNENPTPSKSQLELILDALFEELRTKKEFDPETIEALEELARNGKLSSAPKVEEAISVIHGGDDETD